MMQVAEIFGMHNITIAIHNGYFLLLPHIFKHMIIIDGDYARFVFIG